MKMNQPDTNKLLTMLENIEKMLHEILVMQAKERGEKHVCKVCFK